MKKICKNCNKEKDLSEFYKHDGCKLGTRPECKKCYDEKQLEYQKTRRSFYLEYQKQYYLNNKEKHKKYAIGYKDIKNKKRREKYANDLVYREKQKKLAKLYHENNPSAKKRQNLRKAYNLSLEEFELILEKQNHSCAICGFKDNGSKNFFPFVDHCHSTNKIRGLLCINCNQGLGKFKDNIQILQNAIKYLEDNK